VTTMVMLLCQNVCFLCHCFSIIIVAVVMPDEPQCAGPPGASPAGADGEPIFFP